MKLLASLILISSLIACGGDDDDDDDDIVVTPDAADQPDSGPTPDSAPVQCLADADYGTVTLGNQVSQWSGGTAQMPEFLVLQGTANDDADLVQVELYKGFGVFSATEIVAGTYEITGEELNYATCGVCVRVFTDCDMTSCQGEGNGYLATGGTVTITSVSPSFVGSVDNITMEHVNIADMTFQSSPHPDGCTSAITNTSWDVIPTEASM